MSAPRSIREYYRRIVNKVGSSGCSSDWSAIKFRADTRTEGLVRADALQFKDGATLRFIEEVVLDNDGNIGRPRYSYHYECRESGDCYFFRYDRDPERAEPIVHEECHLHVNRDEPRFKTHATSFGEVFDLIVAHWYSSDSS